MICTERLRSPYLPERLARHIESWLETRTAVQNDTGEERYRFVSGTLPGSWSSNIAANLHRLEWVAPSDHRHSGRHSMPEQVRCLPYVTIEASVHKQMLSHNVYGGPLCPVASARWFINKVQNIFGDEISHPDTWRFLRVDVAEVYDLGSYEAVEEYIRGLGLCHYAWRGMPLNFEGQTVMFPGGRDASTWKAYHKGPEFSDHDHKRLAAVWGKKRAEELQELANRLLRVELSIKSRTINNFKTQLQQTQDPVVIETFPLRWVTQEQVDGLHEHETLRIIQDRRAEMETVRTRDDVKRRLLDVYGRRLANTLLGTWYDLATSGEEYTRRMASKTTFYRHKQLLQEAGVSWIDSDVRLRETPSLIPLGFRPLRSDPRRLVGEAPEVTEQLVPYRLAA